MDAQQLHRDHRHHCHCNTPGQCRDHYSAAIHICLSSYLSRRVSRNSLEQHNATEPKHADVTFQSLYHDPLLRWTLRSDIASCDPVTRILSLCRRMQRQNRRVAKHHNGPNRLPRLRITVAVDITSQRAKSALAPVLVFKSSPLQFGGLLCQDPNTPTGPCKRPGILFQYFSGLASTGVRGIPFTETPWNTGGPHTNWPTETKD
jgi:hypothetical protein